MASVLDFVQSCLMLIAPQPCFDTIFVDFNFFDPTCIKVVISKCLGYSIIAGSILVKVPQIVKIVTAKSGEGLSLTSLLLELTAVIATAAYGFANKYPFSAYGEGIFLLTQNILIGLLCLVYAGQTLQGLLFALSTCVMTGYLMSPAAPMDLLWVLQASNMPIVALSKMVQILENFRNGSTGQLSAITIFLLFAGSLARIFTSIQETGDQLVILTYVVATLCNAILTAQILIYWNVKPKEKTQ